MADGGGIDLEDGISSNLDELESELPGSAADAMLEGAQAMLEWAKANAPWSDRTGAARAGLDVDVDQEGDEIIVTLFHTVDYGLWLEVIQAGRFGIILAAIERFGPEMIHAAGGTVTGGELP